MVNISVGLDKHDFKWLLDHLGIGCRNWRSYWNTDRARMVIGHWADRYGVANEIRRVEVFDTNINIVTSSGTVSELALRTINRAALGHPPQEGVDRMPEPYGSLIDRNFGIAPPIATGSSEEFWKSLPTLKDLLISRTPRGIVASIAGVIVGLMLQIAIPWWLVASVGSLWAKIPLFVVGAILGFFAALTQYWILGILVRFYESYILVPLAYANVVLATVSFFRGENKFLHIPIWCDLAAVLNIRHPIVEWLSVLLLLVVIISRIRATGAPTQ